MFPLFNWSERETDLGKGKMRVEIQVCKMERKLLMTEV